MNKITLRNKMLNILADAQKDRDKRQELVTVVAWWKEKETENIPAWCEYEREVMMHAVNKFRDAQHKPFIGWKEISRIESMAAGHSDYSSKFALYCAELVFMDISQIQP